jgi:polyphosphate glucokinase
MKVLVVDVGGTHVKILASGRRTAREFASMPAMSAAQMVAGVKALAGDWHYGAVAIGYPGTVLRNRPTAEPHNLGRGWAGFDFGAAFGVPAKVINDAAMQALGSYKGGRMLFLGLGTGLGTAMIFNGIVEPMELGHLPYREATFEDYVGRRGFERLGKKKWRRHVHEVIGLLRAALLPDDIVIGGGNAEHIGDLPEGCRLGGNANAFAGGFRLWAKADAAKAGRKTPAPARKTRARR